MAFIAADLYWIVIALAVLYGLIKYHRQWRELALATLYLGGVVYGLAKLAANLINDPRPFVQTGQAPLIASALDNGFPSDHTLLVATVGAILFVVDRPAGLLVGLVAYLIGSARVYVRVHHTLDILGSLIIVIIVLASYLLLKQLWQTTSFVSTFLSRIGQARPSPNSSSIKEE
jgi:membrane-associated phospholipid phosphatase